MNLEPTVLDLRGLKCPLPVLRTRKALRSLGIGCELVVLCTDPFAAVDIPHLVGEEGDVLCGQTRTDDGSCFRIRRAAAVAG